MFIAINKKKVITAVSEKPFNIAGYETVEVETKLAKTEWDKLVGTKYRLGPPKEIKDLRIAVICNWNDDCGISTYTQFLVKAMRPKVKEVRVFSEVGTKGEPDSESDNVVRCWSRGHSMKNCVDLVLAWNPDLVIVQHEFGLFPKATYFLQMCQGLDDLPYVVTMHSVYEHLDKAICTAAAKNIVVHSEQGVKCLRRTGNNSQVFVIPHGCVQFTDDKKTELFNIFHTPYALVQFGFGFFYKGVDRVLDAVHHLKTSDKKFQNIFYVYLCSDNHHTSVVHAQYYDYLLKKIDDLNLYDNAVIIKKFQTEETVNHYLRTAKIALFPYVSDPRNTVFGASGAIRVAMANGIPCIASDCHQFDDLEGVVPRPNGYIELAKEIDEIFSNEKYRNMLLQKAKQYMNDNTWPITADRYIDLYYKLTQ